MPTDPNAQRTRTTWQIGQTAEFNFAVLDSNGNAIELLDASLYPAFAIVDPTGTQVQTGVATQVGPAGNYQISWTIPLQSVISNDLQAWQVEVNGLTKRRNQFYQTFDFNVVDKQVTSSGKKEIVDVCLYGKSYRAFWRGDYVPDELTLECYLTAEPENTYKAPIPVAIDKSAMTQSVDGDSIVYYYDITPTMFFPNYGSPPPDHVVGWRPEHHGGMFDHQYSIVWTVRESPTSPEEIEYQQLRILPRKAFDKVTGVRFMVDRFQHRFGTAMYISDGDIVESLVRGLGSFNQWFPYSSYTADQIPPEFDTFWIMLSSIWMLQSQRMLVGQLNFSFSGQSVTLDYDQTSVIDSTIQGLTEWLNTYMTPAKTMLFRRQSLGGIAAVRPLRLAAGMYNRVYKVDSTGPNGGMANPGLLGMAQLIGLTP
jgi:hypothetical protein